MRRVAVHCRPFSQSNAARESVLGAHWCVCSCKTSKEIRNWLLCATWQLTRQCSLQCTRLRGTHVHAPARHGHAQARTPGIATGVACLNRRARRLFASLEKVPVRCPGLVSQLPRTLRLETSHKFVHKPRVQPTGSEPPVSTERARSHSVSM